MVMVAYMIRVMVMDIVNTTQNSTLTIDPDPQNLIVENRP